MPSSISKKEDKIETTGSTKPKVFIVFYSTYLHVYKLALSVKKGIEKEGSCEVQIFQLAETLSPEAQVKIRAPPKPDLPIITPQLLKEADGILFGFPTRYGTLPAQLNEFLDACGQLWANGSLHGKMAGAFVSTATQHGGQETSIFTLLASMAHFGMIFVPLGYSSPHLGNSEVIMGGSPWGASMSAGKDGTRQPSEAELETAEIQGREFSRTVARFNSGPMSSKSSGQGKQESSKSSAVGDESTDRERFVTEAQRKLSTGAHEVVKHAPENETLLFSNIQQEELSREAGPSKLTEGSVEGHPEDKAKGGSPYFGVMETLATFSLHNELDKDPLLLAYDAPFIAQTWEPEGKTSPLEQAISDTFMSNLKQEDSIKEKEHEQEPATEAHHRQLETEEALLATVEARNAIAEARDVIAEAREATAEAYDATIAEFPVVSTHSGSHVDASTDTTNGITQMEDSNPTDEKVLEKSDPIKLAVADTVAKSHEVNNHISDSNEPVVVNGDPANHIVEPKHTLPKHTVPIIEPGATLTSVSMAQELPSPDVESRGLMASRAFNSELKEEPLEKIPEGERPLQDQPLAQPQGPPQERVIKKKPSLIDIPIPSTATEAAGLPKMSHPPEVTGEALPDHNAPGTDPRDASAQESSHARKSSFARTSATNLRKFFKTFSARSKPNDMA